MAVDCVHDCPHPHPIESPAVDEAGTRRACDGLDGALGWVLPLRVRRCRRCLNSSIVVEVDHRFLGVHLVVIREDKGHAPVLARPSLLSLDEGRPDLLPLPKRLGKRDPHETAEEARQDKEMFVSFWSGGRHGTFCVCCDALRNSGAVPGADLVGCDPPWLADEAGPAGGRGERQREPELLGNVRKVAVP